MSTLTLMGAGPEGGSGAGSAAFAAAVLALSPLLYWKMDDPSGTTATDSSGNARNGTYGSGVTLAQSSLLTHGGGSSISGNGTVNAAVTSSFNPYTGDVTVGGWTNPTNFTAQRNVFGSSNNANGPALVLAVTTGAPAWFTDVGLVAAVNWAAGDVPSATSSFVVLTYNNTSRVSELFVNAASKGQKTSAGGFNATPGNFQYGTWGTNTNGMLGGMDDVFVVSGVLSAGQITTLYNAA